MTSSHHTDTHDSNVELTLFGFETHWIRSKDGQWVDKNFRDIQNETTEAQPMQEERSTSHWWQFWRKNPTHS